MTGKIKLRKGMQPVDKSEREKRVETSENRNSFSPDTIKFLKEEFNQAWSHYRHLENGRNKYVGFSFTLILGTVGFIAAILNQYDGLRINSEWITFGILLFTSTYLHKSAYLYFSVPW